MDGNRDLYLHYQFTDRGGKFVYGIYAYSDRMGMHKRLGEVRIDPTSQLEGQEAEGD